MGAKTEILAFVDGDIADLLRRADASDPAAAESLLPRHPAAGRDRKHRRQRHDPLVGMSTLGKWLDHPVRGPLLADYSRSPAGRRRDQGDPVDRKAAGRRGGAAGNVEEPAETKTAAVTIALDR